MKKEKAKPPPMRIIRDPSGGRISCVLVFALFLIGLAAGIALLPLKLALG